MFSKEIFYAHLNVHYILNRHINFIAYDLVLWYLLKPLYFLVMGCISKANINLISSYQKIPYLPRSEHIQMCIWTNKVRPKTNNIRNINYTITKHIIGTHGTPCRNMIWFVGYNEHSVRNGRPLIMWDEPNTFNHPMDGSRWCSWYF
jgi:hypothetical protein